MDSVQTLRRKLAEYDALPSIFDDLPANLDWEEANPPPLLGRVCRECDAEMQPWEMSWDGVRRELDRGSVWPTKLRALCYRCVPEDDVRD